MGGSTKIEDHLCPAKAGHWAELGNMNINMNLNLNMIDEYEYE